MTFEFHITVKLLRWKRLMLLPSTQASEIQAASLTQKPVTWIPGTFINVYVHLLKFFHTNRVNLKLDTSVSCSRMFKPRTDFIQTLFSEHMYHIFCSNNKGSPDDNNYDNSNRENFRHLLKSEYSFIIFLGHKQLFIIFWPQAKGLLPAVHISAAEQNRYVKLKVIQ
jgi:hypothetical protein